MGFMPLFFLLLSSIVLCSPHNQKFKEGFREKVEDGIYSARDSDHYKDGKHNRDFDHEAVLGSHNAAEEFDHLPPQEAKRRLYNLALKMDLNKDDFVERKELIDWVLHSFKKLTQEEALDEFEDEDINEDGKVTWGEHASETYGIEDDDSLIKNLPEESQMYENDMELFKAADLNGDGVLDKAEFPGFSHPEEFHYMHEIVYQQAMRKRDKNNDGYLDFDEFVADNYGDSLTPESEHFIMEKDRFDNDFDADGDKLLNKEEVKSWLIPNNIESAENEADHLIENSDTDRDGKLSIDEIVSHYDVFVGSEATDFGEQLHKSHKFSDEL